MKIGYIIVSLVIILSLVLSGGCDLLPGITTQPPETLSEEPAGVETSPINTEWEVPSSGSQAQPLPSIADVVARVKPSVVTITTEVEAFDFFDRAFTQEGAGSGWIISEDGIIVTNNHVVEDASSITVTLDDGRTFPIDMSTVATDRLSDLAVLKIDAENLPAATVGDSDRLRVGDWVVAIGNSLGEGIRATLGIVSRKDVKVTVDQGQELYGLIETDVAINRGNSGGPLVNVAGEVIGITTVKIAQVDVEGVGMAISSKEAMPIIQQLINTGYVVRPWLGVGLYPVNDYVVLRYGLVVNEGILVTEVADNSPASRAGLEVWDVITMFAGQEITDVYELTRAIHTAEVGEEVAITFWREDAKKTTTAVLAETPAPR